MNFRKKALEYELNMCYDICNERIVYVNNFKPHRHKLRKIDSGDMNKFCNEFVKTLRYSNFYIKKINEIITYTQHYFTYNDITDLIKETKEWVDMYHCVKFSFGGLYLTANNKKELLLYRIYEV